MRFVLYCSRVINSKESEISEKVTYAGPEIGVLRSAASGVRFVGG